MQNRGLKVSKASNSIQYVGTRSEVCILTSRAWRQDAAAIISKDKFLQNNVLSHIHTYRNVVWFIPICLEAVPLFNVFRSKSNCKCLDYLHISHNITSRCIARTASLQACQLRVEVAATITNALVTSISAGHEAKAMQMIRFNRTKTASRRI
jgi:hypothetical protein